MGTGSFRPKVLDSSACLVRWAVPPVNDFVVGANAHMDRPNFRKDWAYFV